MEGKIQTGTPKAPSSVCLFLFVVLVCQSSKAAGKIIEYCGHVLSAKDVGDKVVKAWEHGIKHILNHHCVGRPFINLSKGVDKNLDLSPNFPHTSPFFHSEFGEVGPDCEFSCFIIIGQELELELEKGSLTIVSTNSHKSSLSRIVCTLNFHTM